MTNKVYTVSSEENASGTKINQILMSIVVCMPILSYGMAMGWISPHKALLMGPDSPSSEPLSEEQISWMASVMFIFAPPAVFLYGIAADRFGRKSTLLAASLPIAIGWSMKQFSCEAWCLISSRALIGFGAGGAFVVSPLYVREISQDSLRGTTGTFVIFSQTAGGLLMYILGDVASMSAVLWISLAVPLLHVALMLMLPETPAFLVKQGRVQDTAKVLGWLRGLEPTQKCIAEDVEKLTKEQTTVKTKFAPKLIFQDKTTLKAFIIALTVNLAREFCGCISVLVYASHIFDAATRRGGTLLLTSNQQAMLLGTVQIVGSFVACSLVDRVGRKPLLATTSAVAGLSMSLLGMWFYLNSIQVHLPGWIPVVSLCVCIFADASGLQPLPFVIMTEMFGFQLRGTVATLIMSISLATDFALLRTFAPLIAWGGYHSTFWLYGAVCLINLVFLLLCVPETKMRSLQEIYADLNKRKL